MVLKAIIILLLFGNLAALGTAFFTMMQDQGTKSNRTAKWLTIRVSLAILLILTICIGVWTGELGVSAPWHNPQG